MFYVCKKCEDGTYGVMDTKDGVVEYYAPKTLITIVKHMKIHIKGISYKDNKWNIKVVSVPAYNRVKNYDVRKVSSIISLKDFGMNYPTQYETKILNKNLKDLSIYTDNDGNEFLLCDCYGHTWLIGIKFNKKVDWLFIPDFIEYISPKSTCGDYICDQTFGIIEGGNRYSNYKCFTPILGLNVRLQGVYKDLSIFTHTSVLDIRNVTNAIDCLSTVSREEDFDVLTVDALLSLNKAVWITRSQAKLIDMFPSVNFIIKEN